MLSRRHISNFEAHSQQVRAFIAVMEEGFNFKEIDFDSYHAVIGDHDCFISFYPAEDPCTINVITDGRDETFHYSTPEDLAAKLADLKSDGDCEYCNGRGKRTITIHSENGDLDADDQECDFCGGTGKDHESKIHAHA